MSESEDELYRALAAARGVDTGPIAPELAERVKDLPAEALAWHHEAKQTRGARRKTGVYYTPPALAAELVSRTLRADDRRVIDPSCGGGVFLAAAYRHLLSLGVADPLRHLHGVDLDPEAVRVTRRTLALVALERRGARRRLVEPPHIDAGDGLAVPDGPFDAVIGNPPWGQKGIEISAARRRELLTRFPSARGIFDWFRPFVERAVGLLRDGGRLGLVLPDILLLKDYEATRAFLLERTALLDISAQGMAFAGATIDAITLVAEKRRAAPRHQVAVSVDGLAHHIPQRDFAANPRRTFNLHLTPPRRAALDRLADHPRLGEFYEVHEGVHSGNLREQLFLDRRVDDSCRELYFGRDELAPFRLTWGGRWLRLAALPPRRTREAYANLGRPDWHERPKILVRRTGDRVTAAVDERGYYASNNFFLVLPKPGAPLDLESLCRYLNSPFATWFFRVVSPRRGRVFAELKICHLTSFPLPPAAAAASDPFALGALPP